MASCGAHHILQYKMADTTEAVAEEVEKKLAVTEEIPAPQVYTLYYHIVAFCLLSCIGG